MLPVGLRIDACPLHKWRGRLLFIFTKGLMLNVPPPSLASQLPQGFSVNTNGVNTLTPCGSWLASDGDLKITSC
jgi:hypothetical protein